MCRSQGEDKPALRSTVPAYQLAPLCLPGNQPGLRSAFSLEGCRSWPVVEGEQGQIPKEWAGIRAYLLHQLSCLQPGWCQQHVTGKAALAPGHRTAGPGRWEALYKPCSDPPAVGVRCLRTRDLPNSWDPNSTPTLVLLPRPVRAGTQMGNEIWGTVLQHLHLHACVSLRILSSAVGGKINGSALCWSDHCSPWTLGYDGAPSPRRVTSGFRQDCVWGTSSPVGNVCV